MCIRHSKNDKYFELMPVPIYEIIIVLLFQIIFDMFLRNHTILRRLELTIEGGTCIIKASHFAVAPIVYQAIYSQIICDWLAYVSRVSYHSADVRKL